MLDIESLLVKMVSFPSLSEQEKPIVDWLESYVRDTGLLEIERFENNILFHLGSGHNWLLLNSHTDVVPPSPDHSGEPFEPHYEDGKIYGRGTTDAKGCGSSMLTALLELAEEGYNPNGRVSLALTVCEEASGFNNGMAYLRTKIDKPDAAIVGEPTSLAPCIAQKGLLILKLISKGDSGHAARVSTNNAIYNITDILEKLQHCSFEAENNFLGKVKITPTKINGGTANNMAPEQVEVILDIRTIPEVPNELIINTIKKETGAEVEIISDRYIATGTDPQEPIAQSALLASKQNQFGSPTSSDWVFLHDIPTVKMGPGHSQMSHKRDEYIEVDQLHDGVKLYKETIKYYFS
ncbi:MAG TPA: M20/M25/M40 family metallo-hydrolase [Balneolales bacterium]|nr:M20/M25/M40 family metallo-hydrolase [Balneolales bacterium]